MQSARPSTISQFVRVQSAIWAHHLSSAPYNATNRYQCDRNALATRSAPVTKHASINNAAIHAPRVMCALRMLSATFNHIVRCVYAVQDSLATLNLPAMKVRYHIATHHITQSNPFSNKPLTNPIIYSILLQSAAALILNVRPRWRASIANASIHVNKPIAVPMPNAVPTTTIVPAATVCPVTVAIH